MHAFGWTIEYTLGLAWPVFIDLFGLIKRVRLDNAIDGMFLPYCAAKYGDTFSKDLFDGRGNFYLDLKNDGPAKPYSEAALRKAQRRMDRVMKKRQEQMIAAAGG